MREIKFRGYSKAINKFVFGCLVKVWSKEKEDFLDDRLMIVSKNNNIYYEIDKDSICQYTGFKDKNGVEIYEGDILEVVEDDEISNYVVCYAEEIGEWVAHCELDGTNDDLYRLVEYENKVIGNTYEEKLKGDK